MIQVTIDMNIKPCPFCGSGRIHTGEGTVHTVVFAVCLDCRARGPVSSTPADAVTRWNLRADSPLLATVREIHAQRADDLCWMDMLKVFAAAGLPAPDPHVGDKFEMLKNCVRYVDSLQAGGPWKSYAELMEWVAWLVSNLNAALMLDNHTADPAKRREISRYVREWFNRTEDKK